jgi:hypothetical protein
MFFFRYPYSQRGYGIGIQRHKKAEAVAYIRTSSAANVGPDKDSDKASIAA